MSILLLLQVLQTFPWICVMSLTVLFSYVLSVFSIIAWQPTFTLLRLEISRINYGSIFLRRKRDSLYFPFQVFPSRTNFKMSRKGWDLGYAEDVLSVRCLVHTCCPIPMPVLCQECPCSTERSGDL